MMIVVVICLSIVALVLLSRKRYLSFLPNTPDKTISQRRLALSFVIALCLYLAYRLEVYEFPYTLFYWVALPGLWAIASAVFWRAIDYVDARAAQNPSPANTQQIKGHVYPQQSPVDKIYAWAATHNVGDA